MPDTHPGQSTRFSGDRVGNQTDAIIGELTSRKIHFCINYICKSADRPCEEDATFTNIIVWMAQVTRKG